MKNKKKIFFCLSAACVLGLGAVAVVNNKNVAPIESSIAGTKTYSLVLNNSNAASGLTSSYQKMVSGEYRTENGNLINVNYTVAKASEGNLVQLGNNGKVFNFSKDSATYYGRLTAIRSITVNFEGTLVLQTSVRNDGLEMGKGVALTSGQAVDLSAKKPYYFCLTSPGVSTTISSVVIEYVCESNDGVDVELASTYTGVGKDGVTYKLSIDGTNVKIASLDKQTNIVLNGTVSVSGRRVTCVFVYNTYEITYVSDLSEDGSTLSFVSKSDKVGGAAANSVTEIDFNKVYTVENFESYSGYGVGYDQKNAYGNGTGVRGAFYSDYYSGSSGSPLGGNGWSLMGSTDYIMYTGAGGHNGSKAAVFKGNSNGLRFLQMKLYEGTQTIIGKGSTLSFWSRGAYKSDFTASTLSSTVKIYAYYNNAVTKDNQTLYRDAKEFTIPAGSDWTQYTMALDSSKNYFGFGIYIKRSDSNSVYTPIDDVEIYTANPYATYVEQAPVEENYCKTITGLGSFTLASAAASALGVSSASCMLSLGANKTAKGFLFGQDLKVSAYTADAEGNFALTCDFSYNGYTVTKVEGKFGTNSLTNVKLTGTAANLCTDNGSVTLNEPGMLDKCEGTTAEMQATWKRWYNNGSWQADTANTDRVSKNTAKAIEGGSSMKIRGYSKYSITFAKDLDAATAFNGFGAWIYNNTGKSITFKLFCYKGTGLTDYINPMGTTIQSADEWVYVQGGFSASIYNIRIYFESSGATSTDCPSIDYIHLY